MGTPDLTSEQKAALAENGRLVDAAMKEGGGIFRIEAFSPARLQELIPIAQSGNPEAIHVVTMAEALALLIAKGVGTSNPSVCGCCGTPLADKPFWAVMAVPYVDTPTATIALGVCDPCCAGDGERTYEQARTALSAFIPRLRSIVVHSAGQA